MNPFTRETIIERRQPQVRWGAIFAGAALSVGLWALFQVWGVGIGLSSIDPRNADSLKNAGIGTGIWSFISPVIAMFFGGLIGGWLASTREKSVGGAHGAIVWALSSVAGVVATVWMVGALAGGAVSLTAKAAGLAGNAVSATAGQVNPQQAMSALGVDGQDLVGPINQKLQQQGKPPITADQLTATIRGVAQRGLHNGQLDRQVLIDEIARNTALSRQDAQDLANQFGDRYQRLADRMDQLGTKVERTALGAASSAGNMLIWAGVTLLASLLAALAGGAIGAGRNDHKTARRERVESETIITPAEPTV
jgi:hypothetical protein